VIPIPFGKYAGTEVKIDGEERLILRGTTSWAHRSNPVLPPSTQKTIWRNLPTCQPKKLFIPTLRVIILSGVNALASVVAWPGRNVVIEKSYGPPTITKDGVTVAKEIELENKFENMGRRWSRRSPPRPGRRG
jgi:hypothetical protein